MTQIRPVSDLRNKFPEVEAQVLRSHEPVFLTKNGYGTMVLMSIEQYDAMSVDVDRLLLEAEEHARTDARRYTSEEVFGQIKERIDGYRHV